MKKIVRIIFAGVLLIVIANSCKKDKDSISGGSGGPAPENVQNITATAGSGYVTISWTYPNDSSYKYVDISYQDTAGKTIDIQYGNYIDTAVITGLANKSYTFTIKAIGVSGGVSTSQTVTVTPNSSVYAIVESTLGIVSASGGVNIKWQNTTGQQVLIQVSYLDADNNKKLVSDTSSKATDSLFIWGIQKGSTTFSILVGSKTGGTGVLLYNQSPTPVNLTGAPLPINLNRFAGTFNVLQDPWDDFGVGYDMAVTKVNDSTLSFQSAYPPANYPNAALLLDINLYSLEITANNPNYADYGTGGNASAYTSGGVYVNNISPSDSTIYLNLNYNLPNYGLGA